MAADKHSLFVEGIHQKQLCPRRQLIINIDADWHAAFAGKPVSFPQGIFSAHEIGEQR
jgi:hypothetical protein